MKNLKEMNDASTQQRVNTNRAGKTRVGYFGGFDIEYVAVANGNFNYHIC